VELVNGGTSGYVTGTAATTTASVAGWFGTPAFDALGTYNCLQASVYYPLENALAGTIIEASLDVYFGADPKFILNGKRSAYSFLRANREVEAVKLHCRMYMENDALTDYWWGYAAEQTGAHIPDLDTPPYGSGATDMAAGTGLSCKIKAALDTNHYLELRIPQLSLTSKPTWERGGDQGYLTCEFDAVGLYDVTDLTDFVAVLATHAIATEAADTPTAADAVLVPLSWNG
jgi:hypothetical protein